MFPLYKGLPLSIEEIELTETWTKLDLHSLYMIPGLEKEAMTWTRAALLTLLVEVNEGDGKGLKLACLRKVILKAVPAFHAESAWEPELYDGDYSFFDFPLAPLKTDGGIE